MAAAVSEVNFERAAAGTAVVATGVVEKATSTTTLRKAPGFFKDFKKACVNKLQELLKSSDTTEVRPSFLVPCVDKETGFTALTENKRAHAKGDDAEIKIFNALYRFGKEESHLMLVLTKFSFKEFTKTLDAMKRSKVKTLFPSFTDFEADFIIIHNEVGVIIIEAKAINRFDSHRYRESAKQLKNVEKFIKKILHWIESDIPIFNVVAFPNSNQGSIPDSDYINLHSEHLKNAQAFGNWWDQFPTKQFSTKDRKKLLQLAAILLVKNFSLVSKRLPVSRRSLVNTFRSTKERKRRKKRKRRMKRKGRRLRRRRRKKKRRKKKRKLRNKKTRRKKRKPKPKSRIRRKIKTPHKRSLGYRW